MTEKCAGEAYCADFKERVAIDMGDSLEENNNIPEERAKIRARWECCDKCIRTSTRKKTPFLKWNELLKFKEDK